MHVHTYIAADPLPRSEILRAAFIGVNWQKHVKKFQGGGISRRSKISRKYGNISSLEAINFSVVLRQLWYNL